VICYELGAGGYGSHSERARLVRCPDTALAEFWLAGSRQVPEAALAAEMRACHGAAPDGPTTTLPA
jgi:hypothetical protein